MPVGVQCVVLDAFLYCVMPENVSFRFTLKPKAKGIDRKFNTPFSRTLEDTCHVPLFVLHFSCLAISSCSSNCVVSLALRCFLQRIMAEM